METDTIKKLKMERMKKMYRFKRILSVVCVVATLLAMSSVVVSADEGVVGDTLGINNEMSNFSELVSINDGKAYLPLRLVFPNLNDKENKIGMTIGWGTSYPIIHLIHGNTTGGDFVDGESFYDGVRSCVDIMWEGDAANGAKAYLTVIKYTYDENGEMNIIEHDESQVLDDLVYLKEVEGGSRMFVSIEDINKLTELLGLDNAYSVKLYKIVY